MKCQDLDCKSTRIATVSARCDDNCNITLAGQSMSDYVPDDMNIGARDTIFFSYCLDCGQIQDSFPLEEVEMEMSMADADLDLDPDSNDDEDE